MLALFSAQFCASLARGALWGGTLLLYIASFAAAAVVGFQVNETAGREKV